MDPETADKEAAAPKPTTTKRGPGRPPKSKKALQQLVEAAERAMHLLETPGVIQREAREGCRSRLQRAIEHAREFL